MTLRMTLPGGALALRSYPIHWVTVGTPSTAAALEVANDGPGSVTPSLYTTEANVLQVRLGAGAWTYLTIDPDTGFSLGAVAAGSRVAFDVRVNIPSGAHLHKAPPILIDLGT